MAKSSHAGYFNNSQNDSGILSAFLGTSALGDIQFRELVGASGYGISCRRSAFMGGTIVFNASGWIFTVYPEKNFFTLLTTTTIRFTILGIASDILIVFVKKDFYENFE